MPSLQILNCEYHNIRSADFSHNLELFDLRLTDNEVETIDLTNCSKLDRIHLAINKISEIDLVDKPGLRLIYLGENNLTELDLTGCNPDKVIGFTCSKNPGRDGEFRVKAWFDNNSIPANFTTGGWVYGTDNVKVVYEDAMGN